MMKPGIPSFEENGAILLCSLRAFDAIDPVEIIFEKKRWKHGESLCVPEAQEPVRIVQYKGSKWSAIYFVDGVGLKEMKWFSVAGMQEFSLGIERESILIQISSCAGMEAVFNFRWGECTVALYSDEQMVQEKEIEFAGEDVGGYRSEYATQEEMNTFIAEKGIIYYNMKDSGRDRDGSIKPLQQTIDCFDEVKEHYLLI